MSSDDRKDRYHELLTFKVMKGLKKLGVYDKKEYYDRAIYELGIIKQTGFSAYFLIVADLIRFMIQNKIRFVVRGSGCGSICVWALEISHRWLDPIRLGLPFERFLNPHRVSNPDLDIDIDDTRRAEVFQFTVDKYGAEHVAKIGNFGTRKARAAVQDVCRALQLPDYQLIAARISSLIPDGPNVTLDGELAKNEALRDARQEYPEVFAWAKRVEGKVRQAGIHAAGTIITPGITTNHVPLRYAKGDDEDAGVPVTQWDMYDVEEAGLLKMDYLGLTTLRVIDQSVYLINKLREMRGLKPDFDIDNIPQDDPKTWELLGRGDLAGVFQVEKPFVRNFARRMNLHNTKDLWQLAVLVSIIRPGMMDTGATEKYLRRTNGDEPVEPMIPKLGELGTLKKTYELLVFQEDCMWVARDLAGFSMAEADNLRRAIAKKKKKDIENIKPVFLKRAVEFSKITMEEATLVWDQMEAFARYGFNNAHAAAYGCVVAYQTAYLKANYPLIYMVCMINSEAGSTSTDMGYNFKVAEYVEEARGMDINVVKPCLTKSAAICRPDVDTNTIVFGLSLIKGLSNGGCEWVLKHCRRSPSFADFMLACYEVQDTGEPRMQKKKGQEVPSGFNEFKSYARVNARDLQALIWSGALDVLMGGDASARAKMSAMVQPMQDLCSGYYGAVARQKSGRNPKVTPEQWMERIRNFQVDEDQIEAPTLEQIIEKEREHTGCFLTYSPFKPFMHVHRKCDGATFSDLEDAGEATMLACIRSVREVICKKGKSKGRSMAFMTAHIIGGDIEVPVFPDTWEKVRMKGFLIEPSKVYLLTVKRDNRGTGFIAHDMQRLSNTEHAQ